jgi:integrase
MSRVTTSDLVADLRKRMACGDVEDDGRARFTRWSKELPGFGVRHYVSGRRIYVVHTRMKGRLRVVTIGKVELIGKRQALSVARRILLEAATGSNPADDRKTQRAAPSFRVFLDIYWERMEPTWKPSTREKQGYYRAKHLDDAFKRRGVDQITQGEVAIWFALTAERGGTGAANRTLEILRALFNKAEAWGYRLEGSNPARDIKRFPPKRHARFLRIEEIQRLGQALAVEAVERPMEVAAIRLLMLTGCRLSEISGLLWSEVLGSKLRLVDSKTGPRTVWLGRDAQAVLATVPRLPEKQHVFWSEQRDHPSKVATYWRANRDRFGFAGLRLHDLRHSFASHAAALSETLPMIGQLLGHRDMQSTARYAHLDDTHLVNTARDIGDWIETMI